MDSPPKRRARFKKGVTPPPLDPPVKLSWLDEYDQKQKERERRRQENLQTRGPLPKAEIIREQFLESTLRYFASATPAFWNESHRRYFGNPSDFMGKLRLGKHLDSYENVVGMCRSVKFPTFKSGRIEGIFAEKVGYRRPDPPDITYYLGDAAEWTQAQAELRGYLGMPPYVEALSSKAQELVDAAASIAPGVRQLLPKELHASWSYHQCRNIVREAQIGNPRLVMSGENVKDLRIVVLEEPLPLLTLPSLDATLDLPSEASKQACDKVCKRIEDLVELEFSKGHLKWDWIVLVRTDSRIQAKQSFGYLAPYELEQVCSKLRPAGMELRYSFPYEEYQWFFAVRPDNDNNWAQVVATIREGASEISSVQKFGLSPEAAALFDWLRKLPKQKWEWGTSPQLTDSILSIEVGLKNPWSGQNAFLFFRLLTEEITRKTSYLAVAHPWTEYSTVTARIEFRAK